MIKSETTASFSLVDRNSVFFSLPCRSSFGQVWKLPQLWTSVQPSDLVYVVVHVLCCVVHSPFFWYTWFILTVTTMNKGQLCPWSELIRVSPQKYVFILLVFTISPTHTHTGPSKNNMRQVGGSTEPNHPENITKHHLKHWLQNQNKRSKNTPKAPKTTDWPVKWKKNLQVNSTFGSLAETLHQVIIRL